MVRAVEQTTPPAARKRTWPSPPDVVAGDQHLMPPLGSRADLRVNTLVAQDPDDCPRLGIRTRLGHWHEIGLRIPTMMEA